MTEEMTRHYDWIGDREKRAAVTSIAAALQPARGAGGGTPGGTPTGGSETAG